MADGLNVNDVVDVTVSFTATGAGFRNFGAMLVVGPSDVIDVSERKRIYTQLSGVAEDFGTTAPEYQFASLFFAQSPQPDLLYIGRWAQTATAGILHGAGLTPAQRLLSVFTAITTGAFKISIDGTVHTVSGLNFSTALNLNGVAATIQTALQASTPTNTATVTWDAENFRFNVESGTTGASSTVSYATSPSTGTDISVILGLSATPTTSGAAADAPVPGIVAETLVQCAEMFDANYGDFYAFSYASNTPPQDSDVIATAAYIEGAGRSRIFGVSSENTEFWDPEQTDDLASVLMQSAYSRTCVTFSTTNAFSFASLFGLFATINYEGSNTTITAKFKQMPGVIAEGLTENQAATLDSKNVNYFVNYQNGGSILQQGVMSNGNFIDSRINADWLANFVQTNVFDLLVALPKLPQTDQGMSLLKNNETQSMQQAVGNGFVAPGQWNGPAFGTLNTGDTLDLGFYIYIPPVASQPEADRAARKAPLAQIAAKEAGAVHSASIMITINP